ncbi:MAG: transketolase C-terminal domain-containing protein [Candidatus Methanomethylicaceae archaeon]|nr:transketolase C-terminal domain-containing protein [Candidatus Verstraetearchaeota archaeon]
MKRVGLSGNYAVAYAAKMADVDVIAAYPITPQTTIVEKLSEFVANGELEAEYINVESEHSALSACVGASLTGARVFTATSSQGLAYMHEVLFMASGLRTPIVMANVNRALSAPLNIWNDHSDAMAERDAGWIQLWTTSAQEAFDATLEAFKIAEEVLLPVMVNLDGFILSHTYEPVILPDESLVKEFVPSKPMVNRVSPKFAYSIGVVGPPEIYYEMKYQVVDAIENSRKKIKEVNKEFCSRFGREYRFVDAYMMEDAEYALVTMGALTGTARAVANGLRKEGERVGVVSIRCFRPFPKEDIVSILEDAKGVGVMDRALTPGGPSNPLFAEIATALYDITRRPLLQSFVAGLGGRDVTADDFKAMFGLVKDVVKEGRPRPCVYVGLRE